MSDAALCDEDKNDAQIENFEETHDDDLVDPRVQVELERLNTATDLINKLEIELDDARSNFRLLLRESSVRVNQLAKKLGSCVEKARPYYEARMHAKQLQTQTQKAALRYERASSAHSAAKEMVYLAEEGLKKEGRCFDPAWQEMLNHATLRVNEAESERVLSQREHQKTSLSYNESEKIVQQLHQELKKSIVKSRPYFEMKAQFNQLLEEQRKKVHHLEENVLKMKMSYADALHNLEEISDQIHQQRKSQAKQTLYERNDSVGAESSKSTWEDINLHNNLKSNSLSSENIYLEHLTSEDTYMSLPPNLKLTPGLVASSVGNQSDINLLNSVHHNSFQSKPRAEELSSKSSQESSTSDLSTFCKYKINEFQNKCEASIQSSKLSEKNIHKPPEKEQPLKEKVGDKDEVNVFQDSLENLPHKLLAPDFNVLRVQREEISDSESLASNDTADTLDDNQIECLLLEKSMSLDISDSSYEENNFS